MAQIYRGDRWSNSDYALAVDEVRKLPFTVQEFLHEVVFVTCDGNANDLHSRSSLAHHMDPGFESAFRDVFSATP